MTVFFGTIGSLYSDEVDFLLMYTNPELSEEDNQLLLLVVEVCESYVAYNRKPNTEVAARLSDRPSMDSRGDEMIVSARMKGGTVL